MAVNARALTTHLSDDLLTLQRTLVEESKQRDHSKLALHRFVRTLGFYRQQLCSVDGALTVTNAFKVQQARDLIKSLEAETRDSLASDVGVRHELETGGAARQSQEVLRQSLEETHRRCESLNADMLHQTEANEELVENLSSVKDANKRLLEQIRFQTDEIAQLTSQRINDEEKMDHLNRAHQSDREIFRQETQRQLAATREAAKEQLACMQQSLTDRLSNLKKRMHLMAKDVGHLVDDHNRARKDVASMTGSFQEQIRGVETEVTAKCGSHVDASSQRRQTINNSIADAEKNVHSEHGLRQSEALSWSHRHGLLSGDKEDLQARLSKDVSQLSSQLQAIDRTIVIERQAWSGEREKLVKRIEDASDKKASCAKDFEQLQQKIAELESSTRGVENDAALQELDLKDLRKQIRESDDALAAAVSGNEHLREQLEEQRKRFLEKNETDLNDCRAAFEQKLHSLQTGHEADVATAQKQFNAMEDELRREEDAGQGVAIQIGAATAEYESVQRDVATWHAQHDLSNTSRYALETEYLADQQHFVAERTHLQAACEKLSTYMAHSADEIHRTREHLEDFKRVAAARETDHETRHVVAQAILGDLHTQRDTLQLRLVEIADAHARVDNDSLASRRREIEAHEALENDIGARKRAMREEREQLERETENERKAREQASRELERQRASNEAMIQQVKDESRTKLEVVGREKARLEETCKVEVVAKRGAMNQDEKRCEILGQDLARVRSLLQESEANLVWVQQELDREERETNLILRQLGEDVRAEQGLLEKSFRDESAFARQIDEIIHTNEQERIRLQRSLEEIRHDTIVKQTEAENRLQREKADLELELRCRREQRRMPFLADRPMGESMLAERSLASVAANGSIASGAGPASRDVGLHALHSRLEGHIQRLQRHTDQLRSSLQTSEPVAGETSFTSSPAQGGAGYGHLATRDLLAISPPAPKD